MIVEEFRIKMKSYVVCMELTKKYGLYIASGKENIKRERLKGNV